MKQKNIDKFKNMKKEDFTHVIKTGKDLSIYLKVCGISVNYFAKEIGISRMTIVNFVCYGGTLNKGHLMLVNYFINDYIESNNIVPKNEEENNEH